MADIRINALATTAASTASDDFIAVDGSANGTRKLNAYSPTFGGNLTVSGTALLGTSDANSGSYFDYNVGIPGAAALWMKQTTKNAASAILAGGGSYTLVNGPSGGSLYLRIGNVDGITLDSSRNTTLAGNLTVSGGQIALAASSSTPSVLITQTDSAGYSIVRLLNTGGTAQSYEFGVGGSGTGSLAQKFYIFDNTAFATRLAIAPTSGNVLLGTTTDSSNGRLQLATHTTSAGGIGFGTDTALFRLAGGQLSVDSTGNNPSLKLSISGTAYGWMEYYSPDNAVYLNSGTGKSLVLRTNGGTTALTLDSSQNVTVANRLNIGGGNTYLSADSSYISYDAYAGKGHQFKTAGTAALTLANTTNDATFAGTVIANKATTAFRIPTAETPASASATGTVGTITWDASYIYVCTAANTWKRVAIATWP